MKIKIALALVATVVTLTGCGQFSGTGSRVSVGDYDRPGGGKVECVNNSEGGIDCDWENATP